MKRLIKIILASLVSFLWLSGCTYFSSNHRQAFIQELKQLGQIDKGKKTEFSLIKDGDDSKVVFDFTSEKAAITVSAVDDTVNAIFYPDTFELLDEYDVYGIGQTDYYLNKSALGLSTANWTRLGQLEESGFRFIEGIPLQQFQAEEEGIVFTPKTLKEFNVMNGILAGDMQYSFEESIEGLLQEQGFANVYYVIGENQFKRVTEAEDGERNQIILRKTDTQ
ncbi:TPA: hypothetical protein U1D11_000166 [Streptococcus suis]|nr:hypothetical protein [Streptococcus suis]